MEIDKQQLITLLEAFVDTTHVFECELALYKLIVQTLCQERGLGPEQIQGLVDRARMKAGPQIKERHLAGHRDLLEKLPRIVELLNSNRDELLTFLKQWRPEGPPN